MNQTAVEQSSLEVLASLSASIEFEDLDSHGLGLVRTALVDTLGVMLAGATFNGVQALRQAGIGEAPGPSLIVGTNIRTTAYDAGLLNGVAAHALDYDDGNRTLGGHPSAILIPTVLALGEEVGASPRHLVTSYAAGFEVMARIADAINPAHYQRGWHPTSTLGVLGASAAAARMLGLDAQGTATAIGAAVSMAAGLKANFGTMVKSLHVGHAVRDGILCAQLAAAGLTASRSVLSADQGFFDLYAPEVDIEAFKTDTHTPRVNSQINTIKQYPCCQSTHCAITAATNLHAGLHPGDIDVIEVIVDQNRIPHTDRAQIRTALEGKFSMQYVVAKALLNGSVGLKDFDEGADRDQSVADLMQRVTMTVAPPGPLPNSFAATVIVLTTSGLQHKGSADLPVITDMTDPPEGMWAKFHDCASRTLPDEQAHSLASAAAAFSDLEDLSDLTALLIPAVLPRESDMVT